MKSSSTWRGRAPFAVSLSLLACLLEAGAQADPKVLFLEDETVVLAGVIEKDPIQVEGSVWISTKGWKERSKQKITAVPAALIPQPRDHRPVVSPDQVSIDYPALLEGKAVQIKIKVKDVAWPGKYSGTIDLSIVGEAESEEDSHTQSLEETITVRLDIVLRTSSLSRGSNGGSFLAEAVDQLLGELSAVGTKAGEVGSIAKMPQ